MRFTLLSALIVIGLGSVFAGAQSENTHQLLTARNGITEISSAVVSSHVSGMTKDSRYKALQQIAQDRLLHLAFVQSKGTAEADGTQAFFIPLLDENGQESGFLAHRGDLWLLSLVVPTKQKTIIEGFTARIEGNNEVVVEAKAQSGSQATSASAQFVPHDNLKLGPTASSTQSSCQYVSSYSINLSCFSWDDNPFGYYYIQVTRFGTTPNPMSPQWWACYQGSIHVCPEFESSGSPLTIPVCGVPPSHPAG